MLIVVCRIRYTCHRVPVNLMFCLQMVLSNVTVDVTIPRHSFVLGQSCARVSASFANVRSMAVAAFDVLYYSLSVLRFFFVLDIGKQLCATRIL